MRGYARMAVLMRTTAGVAPVPGANLLITGVNNTPALAASTSSYAALAAQATRTIIVDPTTTYNTFDGVGFAMTESTSERFSNGMTSGQRATLFAEMFGTNAISHLRVSFGSTDQTYRKSGSNFLFYTYDDTDTDGTLTNFSTSRDDEFVVPRILEALALNPSLRVHASIWSPPAYFKLNGALVGTGTDPTTNHIDSSKFALYAQYVVKAIQAWQAKGVPIYALALQNEYSQSHTFPSCVWSQAEMRDFIKNNLGPAMATASLTTKILVGDDNWANQTDNLATVFSDSAAAAFIDGSAWHGYAGDPVSQTPFHTAYPAKNVYFTEFRSLLADSFSEDVRTMGGNLGTGALRNWSRTVMIWGGALDETGQPNASAGRRGMITVASSNDDTITRNPEYYMLCQLGRTIPRGSTRISTNEFSTDSSGTDIRTVAFLRPDGDIAIFAVNLDPTNSKDATFVHSVDARSVSRTLGPREMCSIVIPSTAASGGTLAAPANPGGYTLANANRIYWSPVAGAKGYAVNRSGALVAIVPSGQLYFEDTASGLVGVAKPYTVQALCNGLGTASATVTLTATAALQTALALRFTTALVSGVANTATVLRKSPGSTVAWSSSDGQSGSATASTFAFTPSTTGAVTFSLTETLVAASNSPRSTTGLAYTSFAVSQVGVTYLTDNFTPAVTNENLSAHAADSGSTWAYKSSTNAGTGTIALLPAMTSLTVSAPATARSSVAIGHSTFNATAVMRRATGATGSISLGAKTDATLVNGYFASYNNQTGVWSINLTTNGTSTVLASVTGPALSASTAKTVVFSVAGDLLSLSVDGSPLLGPINDETYQAIGGIDLRHATAVGADIGFDSLVVVGS